MGSLSELAGALAGLALELAGSSGRDKAAEVAVSFHSQVQHLRIEFTIQGFFFISKSRDQF